jgi:outer membrane protein OmpA-like peptidoglycan-associated protein
MINGKIPANRKNHLIMRPISLLAVCIFSLSGLLSQHSLERLPYPINTDDYDEICPVINYREEWLFFTRVGSPDFCKSLIEHGRDLYKVLDEKNYHQKLKTIYSEIAMEPVDNPSTSSFNQDVWMTSMEDMESVSHPGPPLNNALPNSICSNYSRENEYIIINEFPVDGGMKAGFSFVQMTDDGRFTIPIAIKIKDFRKIGETISLAMSTDHQHIFIAMDDHGNQDIYMSRNAIKNLYARPVKLGSQINTPYRESTPFISQDKNRLYFSSDRPGGYGGMDIYYCERQDYTYRNWSEPKLLGPPINSEYDDSHPYVMLDENTIYFSSDREGTSDIYSAKMYRDDFLDKPMAVNINVYDQDSQLLIGSEILWKEAYKEDPEVGFFRSNTGQYRYIIEDNIPMIFQARRRSLRAPEMFIDPQEFKEKAIHEVTLDFFLKDRRTPEELVAMNKVSTPKEFNIEDILPLEVNRTIVLNNIYFAQSKPDVLEASYPALNNLASVLKRRPHIVIRIEGHTDNVGDKKALMELSWQRAEAIRTFLVEQGVKPENVETEGFGDTKPITNNSTEAKRKQNRRVEIRVIKQ